MFNVRVVAPVPPEATGRALPSVNEDKRVIASTTFVPSQYSTIIVPEFGTVIPVPASVLNVCAKAVLFLTKYSLDLVGQMTLRAAPGVPPSVINILRASSVAPLLLVNV